MTVTYTFTNANNTMVVRSSDNAFIPWDANAGTPLDASGLVGRTWIADGSPAPLPYVAPPPPPPPDITDRQFYTQLYKEGIISANDALAAVKVGTLPPLLANLVSTAVPANAQFQAEMDLAGATKFQYTNPFVQMLGQAFAQSNSSFDLLTFWTQAGTI